MNELHRMADFQAALANFHLSEAAQQTLVQTKLVLLVAPSASGRNTLINDLMKTGDYHYIVSDTTRKPRINNGVLEQDGREYWFKTEEEMLEELRNGEFLEAEIIHGQQVSGISIRELRKAHDDGRIAITDVDIGGIENVMKAKKDTIAIVVLPPSFKEWQRRIATRGKMEVDEYQRRMKTAATIFREALERPGFVFVINDSLEGAKQQVNHIAKDGVIEPQLQDQARSLVKTLLDDTEKLLSDQQ